MLRTQLAIDTINEIFSPLFVEADYPTTRAAVFRKARENPARFNKDMARFGKGQAKAGGELIKTPSKPASLLLPPGFEQPARPAREPRATYQSGTAEIPSKKTKSELEKEAAVKAAKPPATSRSAVARAALAAANTKQGRPEREPGQKFGLPKDEPGFKVSSASIGKAIQTIGSMTVAPGKVTHRLVPGKDGAPSSFEPVLPLVGAGQMTGRHLQSLSAAAKQAAAGMSLSKIGQTRLQKLVRGDPTKLHLIARRAMDTATRRNMSPADALAHEVQVHLKKDEIKKEKQPAEKKDSPAEREVDAGVTNVALTAAIHKLAKADNPYSLEHKDAFDTITTAAYGHGMRAMHKFNAMARNDHLPDHNMDLALIRRAVGPNRHGQLSPIHKYAKMISPILKKLEPVAQLATAIKTLANAKNPHDPKHQDALDLVTKKAGLRAAPKTAEELAPVLQELKKKLGGVHHTIAAPDTEEFEDPDEDEDEKDKDEAEPAKKQDDKKITFTADQTAHDILRGHVHHNMSFGYKDLRRENAKRGGKSLDANVGGGEGNETFGSMMSGYKRDPLEAKPLPKSHLPGGTASKIKSEREAPRPKTGTVKGVSTTTQEPASYSLKHHSDDHEELIHHGDDGDTSLGHFERFKTNDEAEPDVNAGKSGMLPAHVARAHQTAHQHDALQAPLTAALTDVTSSGEAFALRPVGKTGKFQAFDPEGKKLGGVGSYMDVAKRVINAHEYMTQRYGKKSLPGGGKRDVKVEKPSAKRAGYEVKPEKVGDNTQYAVHGPAKRVLYKDRHGAQQSRVEPNVLGVYPTKDAADAAMRKAIPDEFAVRTKGATKQLGTTFSVRQHGNKHHVVELDADGKVAAEHGIHPTANAARDEVKAHSARRAKEAVPTSKSTLALGSKLGSAFFTNAIRRPGKKKHASDKRDSALARKFVRAFVDQIVSGLPVAGETRATGALAGANVSPTVIAGQLGIKPQRASDLAKLWADWTKTPEGAKTVTGIIRQHFSKGKGASKPSAAEESIAQSVERLMTEVLVQAFYGLAPGTLNQEDNEKLLTRALLS